MTPTKIPNDELRKNLRSHKTRISDASSYDEICVRCGTTDIAGAGWGGLAMPCPGSPDPKNKEPWK